MRPSNRSDFVRVRPHHRYVSDPALDLPLDPVLPDDLLVDLPLTREELEGMVPMYQWELVAAAQRQVPIAGGDALVIVQQIGINVLEGQHPWFHDHHDALIWLRDEAIARSMHFKCPPVDLEPEKWLVDMVIELAERRCARLRARAEREDVKEAA
jgi:hypothetical protein